MRRKLIAAVALVMVLAIALCSCGSGNNSVTPNNSGSTTKDYVFKSGSATIAMKAEAEPLLKALGAYKNSYEAPAARSTAWTRSIPTAASIL